MPVRIWVLNPREPGTRRRFSCIRASGSGGALHTAVNRVASGIPAQDPYQTC